MGTTKRARISTTRRVKLFQVKRGLCHLCGMVVRAGETWEVSHVIPLELGGADDESNWDVAHRKCHREHTAQNDIPAIAKAKRMEARHIGASVPKKPLPFGRNSLFKKKLSGQIVRRNP